MAAGARDHADTTWAVATTGIAGPDGGTAEKPVGLVSSGGLRRAVGTEASFVRTERVVLNGDRGAVKRKAVDTALDALVRTIREGRRRGEAIWVTRSPGRPRCPLTR